MVKRLIFDIETNGFIDVLNTIHSLVIKDFDTDEVISCTDRDTTNYKSIRYGLQLLEDADEIIGHNIIDFDLRAIKKLYPSWNFKGKVIDTLVLARLLWPDIGTNDYKRIETGTMPKELRGRYSLEAFGYRLGNYKGDYTGAWDTWSSIMQDYCEQDVSVTYSLYKLALRKWHDIGAHKPIPYSEQCVQLEHDVATIISRQVARGFSFDKVSAIKLYGDLLDRRNLLLEELQTLFPPWYVYDAEKIAKRTVHLKKTGERIEAGQRYRTSKLIEFNPGSRDHISNRLIHLRGWEPTEFGKNGKPTVDDVILSQLPYPEAKALTEYLLINKLIGMLHGGDKAWLKEEHNGKIHGGVISCGAVTRRMTHMKPNVAQTPSNKHLYGSQSRTLFRALPPYKLVGCDADALELRCLAGYMALYDDGAYIETVLKGDKAQGTDIHSVNCRALGLDPTKLYEIDGGKETGREIAKRWFYAFIYGGGNEKLGWLTGVRGSPDNPTHWKKRPDGTRQDMVATSAGRKSRNMFLKGLPALKILIDRVKKKALGTGYLVTIDGGKLPIRSAHSALNTLLQSAGAIFMKKALVLLDTQLQTEHSFAPGNEYEFVANIHDELQLEVLEQHTDLVGEAAAQAIRDAGAYFKFRCPLDAQYKVGSNWAETH